MSENEFMKEQDKWNAILDTLRESGAMNMFGVLVISTKSLAFPYTKQKRYSWHGL